MTALARQAASPSPSLSLDGIAMEPRPKVRVLFVNDTARNGGPGRSLHSILKFLDPAIVHRAVVVPRDGPIAKLLSQDRVVDELHLLSDLVENPIEPWGRPMERRDFGASPALKAVRLAGNVFKGSRAMLRLSQLVRRGRFDLIYCNGTSAAFAGGALAAMTHVPALWHVRYTSVPGAAARLHKWLGAGDHVRRIVCVSKAAAGLFVHCAHKVTIVHNALDLGAFDRSRIGSSLRTELGLSPDVVIVGSHGRVLRRKGYIEMVRAARMVLDRLSGSERARLAFVVVGDTPEDFRPNHVDECRALAAELGITAQFHMLGFRDDIRPLVADFDIAVVPSVYPDPLPRAVIESMAMGKPVIAFDVGGVVEMIDDGLTGELVHFESADRAMQEASVVALDRLANAILRLVRDPELRARQGRAARDHVERHFDARAHAQRIQQEILFAAR